MIPSATKRVVIVGGGGAAGLAAQRQLIKQHFQVIALQAAQNQIVGGTWATNNPISVMYDNLRTNLPRQIMAFPSFPWNKVYVDDRQYPHHSEVLAYLKDYSSDMKIQFGEKVILVQKSAEKWTVKTQKGKKIQADAIIIANGHYFKPKLPQIQYTDFQGNAIHSSLYKKPENYVDQVVVVLGSYASGQDISRELTFTAKKVYLIGKEHTFTDGKTPFGNQNRAERVIGTIKAVNKKIVILQSGQSLNDQVDTIIFATGYHFDFPFFNGKGTQKLKWQDNHVNPLYYHMVYTHDPTLSFIGLPWSVVPFPLFQYQSRFITQYLAGKIKLPLQQQMHKWIRKDEQIQGTGRYYHRLGIKQISYNMMLIKQTESDPLPIGFQQYLRKSKENRVQNGDDYRDHKISLDPVVNDDNIHINF